MAHLRFNSFDNPYIAGSNSRSSCEAKQIGKLMPSTLESRLERALQCPVTWPNIRYLDETPPFNNRLNFEWCADVCKVAVSNRETAIAESWIIDGVCDPHDEELLDAVINLEFTRNRAVQQHLDGIGRLAGLSFLAPSHDGKHFRGGVSRPEIILASKIGPSLFYKNVSAERLCQAFWLWFDHIFWVGDGEMNLRVTATQPVEDTMFFPESAQLWHQFIQRHRLRIAFDAVAPIGASDGQETPYLAYDISVEAKTAHAYPISSAEARDISQGRLFQQRL